MNKSVDNYFIEGCGRCALGGTPDCKVHRWTGELKLLRRIALQSGLTEECKWGVPCYTYQGKNVALIGAFNDDCRMSFLNGALLADEKNILEKPGPNSHQDRMFRVKDIDHIQAHKADLLAYLFEAIEIQKAGLKVSKPTEKEPIPEELQSQLEQDSTLAGAWNALTPGKRRGYLLHFNQAKQATTRQNRVEKCIPKILAGKGFHDWK
ncbi:YdeI/OmpD-associated family protein [Algoriphagus namhaensis]